MANFNLVIIRVERLRIILIFCLWIRRNPDKDTAVVSHSTLSSPNCRSGSLIKIFISTNKELNILFFTNQIPNKFLDLFFNFRKIVYHSMPEK